MAIKKSSKIQKTKPRNRAKASAVTQRRRNYRALFVVRQVNCGKRGIDPRAQKCGIADATDKPGGFFGFCHFPRGF